MPPSSARRSRWIAVAFTLAVLVLSAGAVVAFERYAGRSSAQPRAPAPRTAAIIDQLAFTSPNPAFVWNATVTLQQAGYTVEYIPTEQVTVDFYRELPSRGYGLIIIRGHSGFSYKDAASAAQEVRGKGETFLFSSEPYTEAKYAQEQRDRRLSEAFYFDPPTTQLDPDALLQAFRNSPTYFGIKPAFVKSSMNGTFPRSTVILMGCNGTATTALAKAFVAKGASAVVGWDDLVTAGHTDAATETLLQRLVVDSLPLPQAVAATAAIAGPDPAYGGKLTLYE